MQDRFEEVTHGQSRVDRLRLGDGSASFCHQRSGFSRWLSDRQQQLGVAEPGPGQRKLGIQSYRLFQQPHAAALVFAPEPSGHFAALQEQFVSFLVAGHPGQDAVLGGNGNAQLCRDRAGNTLLEFKDPPSRSFESLRPDDPSAVCFNQLRGNPQPLFVLAERTDQQVPAVEIRRDLARIDFVGLIAK